MARAAAGLGLALLALLGAPNAEASVVGIDLGTQFMKVASGLEIVTNFESKRKSDTLIAFYRGERKFAAEAANLIRRQPSSTVARLAAMIGRGAEHAGVQALEGTHLQVLPAFNETGKILELSLEGAQYTPQELTAMLLQFAQAIAKDFSGGAAVRDAVLTVPAWYTQSERRALLDAATLANLNVLSLIDTTTAVALQWAIDRVYEEPRNVLFYDMGSGGTEVVVAKFYSMADKGKNVSAFEILGKGWDESLGGFAFDLRLTEILADKFNKQVGSGEVRDHPKPMAKLREQARKVKEILSANNEIPVNIEGLHNDVDFRGHVTRSEFTEKTRDLVDRASKPILEALRMAGITAAEVHEVEIVGGGVRVPAVKAAVEQQLKALGWGTGETAPEDPADLTVGQHLNGDEACALGTAFRAANLSTAFRVRKVGLTEKNMYGINVTLSVADDGEGTGRGLLGGLFGGKKDKAKGDDEAGAEWSKTTSLFKPLTPLDGRHGAKKTLALSRTHDIFATAFYDEATVPGVPAGVDQVLGTFNVTGIEAFAKEMADKGLDAPKVSITFRMQPSGILVLEKAEATVEETIIPKPEPEPEPEADAGDDADADAEEAKDGDAATDAKAAGDDAAAADAAAAGGDADAKDAGATGAAADTKEKKEKPKKKKKPKKDLKPKTTVHRRQLTVIASNLGMQFPPLTKDQLKASKAKLDGLDATDEHRRRREAAQNELEAYILSVRHTITSEMEEEIGKVSTEEQRSAAVAAANDAEEWLYDDGFGADAVTYNEKRASIEALAKPLITRAVEAEARPTAVQKARAYIDDKKQLMDTWSATKPQVTEDERGDVLKKLGDLESWLNDAEAKQEAVAVHEDPAFSSKEVGPRVQAIKTMVSRLNKRPKPAPKVEPDTKESDAAEGKEEAATDGAGDSEAADADASEAGDGEVEVEPEAPAAEDAAAGKAPADEL